MRTFSPSLAVAALFVALVNCTPAREAAPVAASASPTVPWPEPPGWRLSDTVRPTRYDASLTVLPTEPRFTGRMRIALDVRAPTHALWLHAMGLTIREATVNREKAEVTQVGNDLLGIRLPRQLPAGAATVSIDYSGAIAANGENGLFEQEEGGRRYAFASMGPMDARRVFPCFDEPSFKAPWKIRLEVKREDVAFANAPVISEEISGEHKVVQFAETKPLPSFLLAMAVGPFDVVDAGVAGKNRVPIRIIVPRGRGAEARFAKEVTGPILNRIEAYLDMPYPYEKLDFVDVPSFGGAMESPGLIMFVQRSLLARPNEETSAFQRGYATTAAHELAHQWFGNLVTMGWWNDMWLHEAFAPWISDRIVDAWKPEWHHDAYHAAETVRGMAGDDIAGVRRLRQPMESKDDMGDVWTREMYGKGAAVLDMFERWIGRDAFRQGLRRYLARYAYGNASAEQFLETALQGAPPSTVQAFASFLNQPGVPQVDVSLRCEAGRPPALDLGQSGKSDAVWQIPVCARYPGKHGEATSCALMGARQGQLVLDDAATCPAWVDANSDAHGYYRVRYLGNLLPKLLAVPQVLTRAEKVALLGDLGAQVRSGASSYADVLAAVSKLADDPTYYVAAATIDLVAQVRVAQIFPESLAPNYARFVRDTYGARAKRLGFVPRAGEAEDEALLRPQLLLLVADSGEDPALRAEAKALAERWLNGQGTIPPALVQSVLNIAARSGDRAMLDLMRNAARARGASNRKERNSILRAMGQFREPDTLRAALALILQDDFEVRESTGMLWETQKTPVTRQVAFDFVKEHYDALMARLPKEDSTFDLAADLPEMVGASFCDAAHAADVESFFRERSARHAGGARGVARAVDAVNTCAAYRERQAPSVAAFLTAIKDGSGRKTGDGRANRSASSPR
ncbi:M1 family metallopeptidase [Pendulispora rubella]|uniref:Aminopeptidase n=1 Tax=Pendulispora rubella TaxID=2741070 RepID=A0ABZ2LBR0_9BACT